MNTKVEKRVKMSHYTPVKYFRIYQRERERVKRHNRILGNSRAINIEEP